MIFLPLAGLLLCGYWSCKWAWKRQAWTVALAKRVAGWLWILFSTLYFSTASWFNQQDTKLTWQIYASLFVLFLLVYGLSWIYESAVDSRWFTYHFRQGRGGSAKWAGEGVFRKHAVPKPSYKRTSPFFFLGRTSNRHDSQCRNVGISGDEHLVTFGMVGSGKSRYVLYNAITYWHGPAIILDAKGELSANTAEQRERTHRADIKILSPFSTRHLEGMLDDRKVCYNFLDEVDIQSPEAMDYISAIADGCIIPNPRENKYWNQNAQLVLEGLIAHAKSTFSPEQQNLAYIADCISGIQEFTEVLAEMSVNPACGGIAQKAAQMVARAGEQEFGYLINGLEQSLKWAAHPAMRTHISRSNMTLRDLIREKNTFYIVLPFDRMKDTGQSRWMRVLLNMGMLIVQKAAQKPEPAVMFSMDEFLALGKFDAMTKNFREMRGAGVRCHLLAQDAASMKQIYGDEWKTFTANSTLQVLGINCDYTSEWVSKRLGEYRPKDKNGEPSSRPVSLLTPAEVERHLGKNAGNQIVIPSDGPPWQIKSVDWFKSRHSYRKKI